MSLSIRPLNPIDWPAVRRIYAEGIATDNATFEQSAPDWDEWDEWDAGKLTAPRLAAEVDSAVAGWAALSPTSKRHVNRGVAEVSVYVAASVRGQGVGRALLAELVEQSEGLRVSGHCRRASSRKTPPAPVCTSVVAFAL